MKEIVAMTHKALIVTLVLCLSAQASAGGEKDPWRAFELGEIKVDGVRLRYGKTLELDVDAIRKALSEFLKEQAEHGAEIDLLGQTSEQIVEQVNRIVGFSPSKKEKAEQHKMLSLFLGKAVPTISFGPGATIYLISKESTKDYLRKGGSLPGFTYNKAEDQANYKFAFNRSSKDEKISEEIEIAVPVEADRAEKQFSTFLAMIGGLQVSMRSGLALHELVEITMLKYRLRPRDPYFRWFSDGFANAIVIHLLKNNVGEEVAADFAQDYDTKKYAALEKQINLRYWMGLGYCIETPLKSEKELNYARYCYATLEATRLIDKHGIGCVAKILDKACKNASGNNSRDLIPAIKEVTGEDMEKRFLRYQTFKTSEEGIKQYGESYNAALAKKDGETALPALIRLYELRAMSPPDFYSKAAFLLLKMGHEEVGDQVILGGAELLKERDRKEAYVVMHAVFIDYAFKCNNPKKAVPSAEIVLESKPDHVPALAIRMVKLRSTGDVEGAKKIAQRILELEKDPKSHWRKIAEQFQLTDE